LGRLLKSSEERELSRLKKEANERQQKIQEIEQKERERQGKINQAEGRYQAHLSDYMYRCENYLAHKDAFDRLVWFMAQYGRHRKKYSDVEWDLLIKASGLDSIRVFINRAGSPAERPPVKQTIDPLED
jgi:hypothetical protein